MERERVTISIKSDILKRVDSIIDSIQIRNRSHAIEHLITQALDPAKTKNVIILLGGKKANKLIPKVREILSLLKEEGFNKVYIALGALAEKAKEEIGKGERFGIQVNYTEEGEGTGGAILPLKKNFKNTFVVINPEGEIPNNINEIINFHRKHATIATVAATDLSEMVGLYVFEPEIFNYISPGFTMLENDVFPEVIKDNQLIAYPMR